MRRATGLTKSASSSLLMTITGRRDAGERVGSSPCRAAVRRGSPSFPTGSPPRGIRRDLAQRLCRVARRVGNSIRARAGRIAHRPEVRSAPGSVSPLCVPRAWLRGTRRARPRPTTRRRGAASRRVASAALSAPRVSNPCWFSVSQTRRRMAPWSSTTSTRRTHLPVTSTRYAIPGRAARPRFAQPVRHTCGRRNVRLWRHRHERAAQTPPRWAWDRCSWVRCLRL